MALSAPTVASDPATATHTNNALTIVNNYINNAYSAAGGALSTLSDHAFVVGGHPTVLADLATALGNVTGGGLSAPSVATSPATQAQTNAALATAASYIDRANARLLPALTSVLEVVRKRDGNLGVIQSIEEAIANLSAPTAITPETVASDPVSAAHMNSALANTVAFIDTVNAELANALDAVLVSVNRSLSPSYGLPLQDSIAALRA